MARPSPKRASSRCSACIDLDPPLRDLVPAAIAPRPTGGPIPLARLTANLAAAAPPELLAERLPVLARTAPAELEDSGISCCCSRRRCAARPSCRGRRTRSRPAGLATLERLARGPDARPHGSVLAAADRPQGSDLDLSRLARDDPGTAPAGGRIRGADADPRRRRRPAHPLRTGRTDRARLQRRAAPGDPGHGPLHVHQPTSAAARAGQRSPSSSSGSVPGPCPASSIPQAIPLPPASLREVHPARSPSPAAGRVAAAAAITLEDVVGQPPPAAAACAAAGGKGAGSMTLALQDLVDVDGRARQRHGHAWATTTLPGTLQIRGRLAGSLRLSGRTPSRKARPRPRAGVAPAHLSPRPGG